VDTEWAIDLLSQSGPGEYQKALGEVSGWYVLTWLDKRMKAVYLLNWEGSLSITHHKGVFYYSSAADHLRTAVGAETKIASIPHGNVMRFHWHNKEGLKQEVMPTFVGKKRETTWVKGTDYRRHHHNSHYYDDGDDTVILGRGLPATTTPTRRPVVIQDPTLPSGQVVKFPTGLWWAQLLNNKYRLLKCSAMLDELYPNSKTGDYHFMRPGEVRNHLTTQSPENPPTDLPPGIKGPPDLSGESDALQSSVSTAAEKKTEKKTAVDALFPSEEAQERADLAAAKAIMDKESDALDAVIVEQRKRFNYLTNELDLTENEATRVMSQEGYFSPFANA
jgi:hypothetical protein